MRAMNDADRTDALAGAPDHSLTDADLERLAADYEAEALGRLDALGALER